MSALKASKAAQHWAKMHAEHEALAAKHAEEVKAAEAIRTRAIPQRSGPPLASSPAPAAEGEK